MSCCRVCCLCCCVAKAALPTRDMAPMANRGAVVPCNSSGNMHLRKSRDAALLALSATPACQTGVCLGEVLKCIYHPRHCANVDKWWANGVIQYNAMQCNAMQCDAGAADSPVKRDKPACCSMGFCLFLCSQAEPVLSWKRCRRRSGPPDALPVS